MKKSMCYLALGLLLSAYAQAEPAQSLTALPNLAGTYNCTAYDSDDGNYQSRIILTLDAGNSETENGYVAYRYQESTTVGDKYSGSVLANGNMLAQHFENNEPDEYDDRGVANITATYGPDAQGINHVILHEYYYEPGYGKGDMGSETCTQQN